MSIRPSFQFYPADWRGSGNLSICTFAAQGVWMRCLCIFHDSDEYGLARWSLKKLAKSIGCRQQTLHELVTNHVLKGSDENFAGFYHTPMHARSEGEPVLLIPPCEGSCWYSSRMVIDEWRRTQRGASTRFTTKNNRVSHHPPVGLVNTQTIHPPVGLVIRLGDGPSSSSSVQEDSERESLVDRPVVDEIVAEISPTPHPVKKNGTRWPSDAVVPDDWIDAAANKRHDLGLNDLDLAVEAEMFANYWSSKAGAAATKIDWRKTWMNWSLNSSREKFNGKHTGNGRRPTTIDNHLAGIASLIGDIRKGRA